MTSAEATGPSWIELRAVALVGTERRPLSSGPVAGLDLDADPAGPADQIGASGAERRALLAAAVLGARRRAGARAEQLAERDASAGVEPPDQTNQMTGSGTPEPWTSPEPPAPTTAAQLLELLLTGGLGRPATVTSLVSGWLDHCARAGLVVPNHLLVAILDYGTATPNLQPGIAAVVGQRGRWLAAQRKPWAWVAGFSPAEGGGDGQIGGLGELLGLPGGRREAVVRQWRRTDAAATRDLVEEALSQLDAPGRAELYRALAEGLGPDDEAMIETGLDDRSKVVRRHAVELANGLTTSARAQRLTAVLAPLVAVEGDELTVAPPASPTKDERRDMAEPSGDREPPSAAWLRTLIAGVPLNWWERSLGWPPQRIVDAHPDHLADDLLTGWARAALAENEPAWLDALVRWRRSPELQQQATPMSLCASVERSLGPPGDAYTANRIVGDLVGPWSLELSELLIAWFRRYPGHVAKFDDLVPVVAERLHSGTEPLVDAWLQGGECLDNEMTRRQLQSAKRRMSIETSIADAFITPAPSGTLP